MNISLLEKLAKEGKSIRQIALVTRSSYTTVRYWLKKYGIKTKGQTTPKWDQKKLRNSAAAARSFRELANIIGLKSPSGSYTTLRRWTEKKNIDVSHFLKRPLGLRKRTLEEIMVSNSSYSRYHLKQRLFAEGIKVKECEICGQGEEWKGQKLSFVLDHINGINNDHRLENIRIVCPNCDSTLPTFSGRNVKRTRASET